MNDPVIVAERSCANGKRLGFITLNAVKSLNTLTQPMIDILSERLRAWRDDPDLACVVLLGTGEKAFCAGGDVVAMYRSIIAHPDGPKPEAEHLFATEYRLDYLIHTYNKPVLCWGHGIVMGGGLGLMVGASHRVMTETSRIAMPETAIGLYPDVGATWFLNRMPGRVGLYLGLTGSPLNAADALFVGLGDYFITQARQRALLAELGQVAWTDEAESNHGKLSLLLRRYADHCRYARPDSVVQRQLDFIQHVTDYHSVADIAVALGGADNDDPWVGRGAAHLMGSSPTSLQVFFEQYRRGRYWSLREVFQQELAMSVQFVRHADYAEGVRALLIDKDRSPRWAPARLEEVDAHRVAEHFRLPDDYDNNPLADL